MSAKNFTGLDIGTLYEMRGEAANAIRVITTTGQSHTLSGRTFTQANLSDLSKLLGDINGAIALKSGRGRTMTLANYNLPRS